MRLRAVIIILISILVLIFTTKNFTAQPAIASIQKIEEAPGQILYQYRQSLQDDRGNSWQIILFKETKTNQPDILNLRLVAFPGVAEFEHPKPLELKSGNGQTFKAKDSFANQSPAANVGQYDFSTILNKLPQQNELKLFLPLTGARSLILTIPHAWVEDWKKLAITR